MPAAPILPHENERLHALHRYGVLDTPPEDALDDLVALAARICATSISLVTLIAQDRQWIKARHGTTLTETTRALSFCAHAMGQPDELLIIPDATQDARFSDNPFVTGQPGIRFYAGMPLRTADGHAIGTLCVVDHEPRTLSADQQESLRVLGRQVMVHLDMRRSLNEAILNDARLKNSQRIAGLGDWEYDFAHHRLLWSDEIYHILGLSREDSPPDAENFYRVVHPDDLAFVHREKKAAAEGSRRVDFEYRILRANGEVRTMHQISEMIFDAQGHPARELGTIQDITKRKHSVEELLEKTAFLEAQVDASLDGILVVDTKGKKILQNQRLVTLLRIPGWLAEENDDEKSFQFVAALMKDSEAFIAKVIYLYAHPDETSRDEVELKDGSVLDRYSSPVRGKDGKTYGRIWTFRDITAQKAAVQALRQSEERFKFVARAVSDVVWDWDLAAGTLWWNDGFLTTFGFNAGEIEPSIEAWTGRIHADERSCVIDGMRQAIATGVEVWGAEYRFQRKDGSYALVQDRGYILRTDDGRGVRMVGGMRDLTEQKKMEAQYLRAERMESIGTLAGGIAHDLNNVLTPILMSIELLKKDDGLNARRGKILDIIQTSGKRGAELVRQVLAFARGLEGQRIPLRLQPVIEDLESIISETFPRNIRIASKVAADLWTTVGDQTQLHQVLLNLAVNARDAMPQGGTLFIEAGNISIDTQYAAMSAEAQAGPYILLQVRDTGLGIPPEVRDRIFEPFFTTKELGKGTGIGLATVHTVVKSHGGFLAVESEMGQGTTFKIYLPAEPTVALAEDKTPSQIELPSGQGELVLVVDDEFAIQDITRQTLEAFGYRVIVAGDGAEAIALYAQNAKEIAVVLTDMMMPIMDGAAMIQVLLRINPLVKIIATSGLESMDPSLARRNAAQGFLLKPYTAGTLLSLLHRVLDQPAELPHLSLDEKSPASAHAEFALA